MPMQCLRRFAGGAIHKLCRLELRSYLRRLGTCEPMLGISSKFAVFCWFSGPCRFCALLGERQVVATWLAAWLPNLLMLDWRSAPLHECASRISLSDFGGRDCYCRNKWIIHRISCCFDSARDKLTSMAPAVRAGLSEW